MSVAAVTYLFSEVFDLKPTSASRAEATPQEHVHKDVISAESAIHSNAVFGHIAFMPQSLSNVILHIIFSTKNREPWLDSAIRPRMHAYLATICRNLGGEAFRADGVSDHVHIVTTLPRM